MIQRLNALFLPNFKGEGSNLFDLLRKFSSSPNAKSMPLNDFQLFVDFCHDNGVPMSVLSVGIKNDNETEPLNKKFKWIT